MKHFTISIRRNSAIPQKAAPLATSVQLVLLMPPVVT